MKNFLHEHGERIGVGIGLLVGILLAYHFHWGAL